jgi:hypothetical protein
LNRPFIDQPPLGNIVTAYFTQSGQRAGRGSGLGLEAQRLRIAAYCTMKGLHLAETFEDPCISAGKLLASRPGAVRPVRLHFTMPMPPSYDERVG